MSRRRLWLMLAMTGVAVVIFGGSVLWRAGNTLGEMRERVASEGSIPVSAKPFITAVPAGLEIVGAPASLHRCANVSGTSIPGRPVRPCGIRALA